MARLRCYFSFRSPYSWLAMKSLAKQGMQVGSTLEYLPFIEPAGELAQRLYDMGGECLYRTMSPQKHLYILGDIKRQAKELGLTPKWPVDVDVDWSIPHKVFLVLTDDAIKQSFLLTCADKRFLEGKNIFNWGECQSILLQWLDKTTAAQVIDDAQSEKGLSLMTDVCYQAYIDDVFGVPFFIAKREKYWGNDRLDRFVQHCRRMELV